MSSQPPRQGVPHQSPSQRLAPQHPTSCPCKDRRSQPDVRHVRRPQPAPHVVHAQRVAPCTRRSRQRYRWRHREAAAAASSLYPRCGTRTLTTTATFATTGLVYSGQSVWNTNGNGSWGTFASGAPGWIWHEVAPLDRDGPFTLQANAFLDQIEGQPSRLCTLEAGAATLRFNLSALASAESGRRIACALAHA